MSDELKQKDKVSGGRQGMFKLLGIFGLLALLVIGGYFYLTKSNFMLPMMLIGALAFAPIGIFVGWAMGDKYAFAKFLRSTTKKNFGVIQLVEKDGKNIVSFVKNLSADVIEWANGFWHIDKDRIYNDKGDVNYAITSDHLKYIAGVPTLFLDANSFSPLNFWRDPNKKTDPREITLPAKAWIVTKEMELLSLKKVTEFLVIAMIFAGIAAAGMAFITLDKMSNVVVPQLNSTAQQVNDIHTWLINSGQIDSSGQVISNTIPLK